MIKPGTIFNDIFASYDWLPTFVEIAGGPKGDELNKQIMAGKYEGIMKTKLAGINQLAYLQGKTESNRDYFFYYQGHIPSAVRYKNWKFYYTMMGATGIKSIYAPETYAWTQVDNIARDPFEQAWGDDTKSASGCRRRPRRPEHGVYVRLEHPAHRPAHVGEGTRVLR